MKEMVTVILGILIALVINDLKEDYDDRKFISRSFENMSVELNANLEEINSTLAKQDTIMDILWDNIDNTEMTLGDILSEAEGLQVASIKNIAWQAILNKNIQLIDYEIVSNLADIDESDEVLNMQITKLIDYLYTYSDKSDYKSKETFDVILEDLMYTEEQLIEAHKKCLELINAN